MDWPPPLGRSFGVPEDDGLRRHPEHLIERRHARSNFQESVVQESGTSGESADLVRRSPLIYGGDDFVRNWQKLEDADAATEARVTAEVAPDTSKQCDAFEAMSFPNDVGNVRALLAVRTQCAN